MKKKIFKRAGVAVLSMAMLLSMGAMTAITTNATPSNDPVTITAPAAYDATSDPSATATYKFYKVLNATASGSNYTYTVNTNYNGITTVAVATAKATATAAEKQAYAETLLANKPASADYTVNSGSTVNVAPGFYVIEMDPTGSQMTAAPILLSVTTDMDNAAKTLAIKTSGVTFGKKLTSVASGEGSVNTTTNKGQGAIGSVFNYTITSKIPNYSDKVKAGVKATPATIDLTDYVITDTPSNGITIYDGDNKATINGTEDATAHANTITVTCDQTIAETDYTVDKSLANGGFTVTLTDAYVVDHPGATVTVTFQAVINDNAAISNETTSTAIPNTGTLVYDNDYKNGGGSANLTETPNLYTVGFDFTKTFNGVDTAKAGAAFELKNGSTVVATFTTTAADNGNKHTFSGLAAGTYTLHETACPDGFTLAADKTVTITADLTNTDVYTITDGGDVTVDNNQNQALPGTGGMGTILFTVGGAAIVLLAGAMFVLYMKKRRVEE